MHPAEPVYTGRVREYMREWHAKHPGYAAQKVREFKARHPGRVEKSRAKWVAKNPDKQRAARNAWRRDWRRRKHSHYMEKFGVSLEHIEAILLGQGSRCGICGIALDMAAPRGKLCACVDHCHTTGHIRGVLCLRCNQQLGHYEAWPEFTAHAVSYLERAHVEC